MDRHDDIKTSKMMERLLDGIIPPENELEYITDLLIEASTIIPDKKDLIKITTLYAEIIGKCYLYAMFYEKLYGDP